MKKGFTLIELLVVVLIIGILAAVALPQYEKAVEKSRMAEAITFISSLRGPVEVYALAGGPSVGIYTTAGSSNPGSGIGGNNPSQIGYGSSTFNGNLLPELDVDYSSVSGDSKNFSFQARYFGGRYLLSAARLNESYILQSEFFNGTWNNTCIAQNEKGTSLCQSLGSDWTVVTDDRSSGNSSDPSLDELINMKR